MTTKALVLLTAISLPFSTPEKPTTSDLYNRYKDSVVWVGDAEGHGSGYVVRARSGKKVIVTNAHVCDHDDADLTIRYENNSESKEVAITVNPGKDICLVSLEDQSIPALELSDELPSQGDNVYTIGFPRSQPKRINAGQILETDYVLVMPRSLEPSIIVTAQIEPGQSGSPMWNDKGKVIGTIYAGNGEQGAAMPTDHLRAILRRY